MQRILITGASRGIGAEFVQQYARRGDMVFAGMRTPSNSANGQVTVVKLDVTSAEDIANAVEIVRESVGTLDILINNAALNPAGDPFRRAGKYDAEAILNVLHTNSVAPLMLGQAFLPLLKQSKNPRIANITSQTGSFGWNTSGGGATYSASKAALNMFTRAFANDSTTAGITTILIHPGWVRTDMGGGGASLTPEDSIRQMIALIDRVTRADNGKFFKWDGSAHVW
jgi:NAD(P)-dependent dehydrogenase (short-subunit alcohol dehydrogenase family)